MERYQLQYSRCSCRGNMPRQNGSAHTAAPARPGLKEATPTKLDDGWGSKGGAKALRRAAMSRHILILRQNILPGHFVPERMASRSSRHFVGPLCPGTYGEYGGRLVQPEAGRHAATMRSDRTSAGITDVSRLRYQQTERMRSSMEIITTPSGC